MKVIRGGTQLQHRTWPMAEDDRGALIPLEMLYVEKEQALIRCGHLKPVLLDKLRRYLKDGGDHKIRRKASNFFNRVAAHRSER
jgi:hypothetical protein